jgi:hypothetical protein
LGMVCAPKRKRRMCWTYRLSYGGRPIDVIR